MVLEPGYAESHEVCIVNVAIPYSSGMVLEPISGNENIGTVVESQSLIHQGWFLNVGITHIDADTLVGSQSLIHQGWFLNSSSRKTETIAWFVVAIPYSSGMVLEPLTSFLTILRSSLVAIPYSSGMVLELMHDFVYPPNAGKSQSLIHQGWFLNRLNPGPVNVCPRVAIPYSSGMVLERRGRALQNCGITESRNPLFIRDGS